MSYNKSFYIIVFILLSILFSCNKDYIKTEDRTFTENNTSVTIDEAEAMLLDIMSKIEGTATKSTPDIRRTISQKYSIGLPSATKSEEKSLIHIFNFENESGFAIMSGDKRAEPLLAYALSGNIHEGDTIDNPGLGIFMSRIPGYFSTLDSLSSDKVIDPDDLKINGYFTFAEMINGPCPVKWNQSYPFNYYCEEYSRGKLLTGCVVTATAQLMATYRYPDSYNGYKFDWDKMIEKSNELFKGGGNDTLQLIDDPNIVNGNNDGTLGPIIIGGSDDENKSDTITDPALLQIAWLMHELGKPENIDNFIYKADSSATSATIATVPKTLENFSYSSGGERVDYFESIGSIINLDEAVAELENGYYIIMGANEPIIGEPDPILYAKVGDGHCWLVHGLITLNLLENDIIYDKHHYFLCNFGWGGAADGYYLSNVFDTMRGPIFDEEITKSHPDEGNYSEKTSMDYILKIRK